MARLVIDGQHAGLQVAGDRMLRDEALEMGLCILRETPQRQRVVPPDGGLEIVLVAAMAAMDLPAIAARGARGDLGGFEHDDGEAALGERKRRSEPGIAGPDDADVGPHLALERRLGRERMRRGPVV